MIISALSSWSRYAGGDPYLAADQYGDAGPATISYGSDYGTGAYSDYNSDSGRYTTTIQIAGYGSQSDDRYGYMAGTDDRYSAGTSTGSGGTYGYAPEETMHSYEDVVFEYVIDVLDGDVEI